jgi:hypothetical protein
MDEHPYPTGGPPATLNPWFSIWLRPRVTMRQILDTDPRRNVHLLAVLSGIVAGLGLPLEHEIAKAIPMGMAVLALVGVVVGALVSLVGLYVGGFMVALTGRWLGGRGNGVAIRSALAWSSIPSIWGGLLLLPRYVLVAGKPNPLDSAGMPGNLPALFLVAVLGIIQCTIAVWQLVIMLKCIGEAHGFSAWHALGAALLAALLIGCVVAIPVALIVALAIGMR